MGASTETSFTTLLVLFFFGFLPGSYSATIIVANKCSHAVWPAISSGAGTSPLSTTGFALRPGDSTTFPVPPNWSGRIWGRTLCTYDINKFFSCATGDCGSSTIECASGKATPPVTLVEFTLNGTGGLDIYDVSLVDGFNLPVRVEPRGGNCRATGCATDLNVACPTELELIRDGERVACKSECQAEPCFHSEFFKTACPHAHVYSDDHGSFTCASAAYTISFCPISSISPGSKKHPAAVDNSGGHADDSPINTIAVVIAAVVSICGLFIVCQITIRLRHGDCVFCIGAGARTETISPNPHVTV